MKKSLTLIKLGGSVITNKSDKEIANTAVIHAMAEEVQAARIAHPAQQLVIGHGSGSFGHVYAAQYHVHRGLAASDNWIGYALTSGAAMRLNRIVVDALLAANVPAVTMQPSASLQSQSGKIASWHTSTIVDALNHGLVPVVYGDVSLDTHQGCAIISTEQQFGYLVTHTALQPDRMIIVGQDAVYTADPHLEPNAQLIPLITQHNIDDVLHLAGESLATDVTGGMHTKIKEMWHLVQALPHLQIHILGYKPGALYRVLTGEPGEEETVIKMA